MKKVIAENIEKPLENFDEVSGSNENEFGQAYSDFLAERNNQNQVSGQHVETARKFEEIIKELLDLKPIEKKKYKTICLHLPLPMYEKISELSKENKLSRSRVIIQMIDVILQVISQNTEHSS